MEGVSNCKRVRKGMEEFTLGVISSILISFKALFRVLPAPKILAHYYL